jgi:hypothetical protein
LQLTDRFFYVLGIPNKPHENTFANQHIHIYTPSPASAWPATATALSKASPGSVWLSTIRPKAGHWMMQAKEEHVHRFNPVNSYHPLAAVTEL